MKPKKRLLRKVLKRSTDKKICYEAKNPFDCVLGTCEKCNKKEEAKETLKKEKPAKPKKEVIEPKKEMAETKEEAVKSTEEKPAPKRRGRRRKVAEKPPEQS